ncbi:hypothetical protein WM016_04745 [Bifidobacterium mongoliense]|uniref:helix-turn-helix transcriptional regulator n=1 Tax=Bifidobacterium mongoliense TaxID=518643 RepID=UPI0030EBD488
MQTDTEQTREQVRHRVSNAADPDDLRFTVSEASAYIPMPKGQLAQLRYTGKGPRFMKPTARTVLYRKGDIDEWLNASVRTSTVEAA